MPSRQLSTVTPTMAPLPAVRQQAFASKCAEELRKHYPYVTAFPESGDSSVDALVQSDTSVPIPVRCSLEAITRENVRRFTGSLLVRAFRRGVILTGDGQGPFSAEGYVLEVMREITVLRGRGIEIKLLPLTELHLLQWA